jgi:hypothetical protein
MVGVETELGEKCERGILQRCKEKLLAVGMFIFLIVEMVSQAYAWIKCIKSSSLNICNFVCHLYLNKSVWNYEVNHAKLTIRKQLNKHAKGKEIGRVTVSRGTKPVLAVSPLYYSQTYWLLTRNKLQVILFSLHNCRSIPFFFKSVTNCYS